MKSKLLTSLAAVAFAAASANASLVIDQAQLENDDDSAPMSYFSATFLAQSFQQDSDNIAGASVFLLPEELSGNVTISLWDALPIYGGNQLATGTELGNGGDWVDVLWSPIAITAGQTYFLVISSDNQQLGIGGTMSDTYAAGNIFANASSEAFDFDFAFRTYADVASKGALNGPQQIVMLPVPEPSTYGLIGAATLALMIGYRRFKARAA